MGLSRFSLDALLGSRAIQAHCAERTLRLAHLAQLGKWAEATLRQKSSLVLAETTHMSLTLGLVIWLVCSQAARAHIPGGLLLINWALSIPAVGRQLASISWSFPAMRNSTLRLLEPLGAHEEDVAPASTSSETRGVQVEIDKVSVVAGGRMILNRVSLAAAPGEHIGIVGISGSGKSSLVGLLLGWHRPVEGPVRVDGVPLDAGHLAGLRRATAWIDPQVHLFQATLLDNIRYGNNEDVMERLERALEGVGLLDTLQRLPAGLQTPLGDGGALVAGGEGQLFRMSRART